MNTPPSELALLRNADDYRVRAGSVDPRGWQIQDSNEIRIGEVDDLIIDVSGLTTRYIVCSVGYATERSVLIPVGFARLDQNRSIVHLDFVTAADVEKLPTFNALPLTADFEAEQEKALTGVEPDTGAKPKIVRRSP